jgi:large subunit ribosomal protein L29
MQATEIRSLSTEEIQNRLDEAYQSLFRLRFDWASGQLEDNNRLPTIRRDIARMKTVLREREIAADMTASANRALEA